MSAMVESIDHSHETKRSSVLAAYRNHPGLQQRLREKCRVDLSFALHRGWAIEGAVGSDFKIDASYISPNAGLLGRISCFLNVR